MSDAIETAKLYIEEENYEEAFKLAKKRHGKDDVTSYLTIIDLLIEKRLSGCFRRKRIVLSVLS